MDNTSSHDYIVEIKTGRYKGQTLKCLGNVVMRFYSKHNSTPSQRYSIGGKFQAGKSKSVKVQVDSLIHDIEQVEVWLERPAEKADVRWFVEHMQIKHVDGSSAGFFPFHRWVTMKHQMVRVNNCVLPQHDPNQQRRNEGIHLEKDQYYFSTKVADAIPVMTEASPTPESFTISYTVKVFVAPTIKDTISQKALIGFTRPWNTLLATDNIYNHSLMFFPKPRIVDKYIETLGIEDWSPLDKVFGSQRLIGVNPAVIQRVLSIDRLTETIDVTDGERFAKVMNMSLSDAISNKKLYMVDYTTILRNLICKNGMIVSPIAMFYVNEEDDLMPVAIQLFRNKAPAGPDNPVFFPDDDKYAWMLAKTWFNNADAAYHQSVSHLGFTHLLIETMYLALRQTVSISHPLYHLMAPHFLYLLSVNEVAFKALINDGGWVDTSMTTGVKGMYEIIRRRYQGCANIDESDSADPMDDFRLDRAWRLDIEGNLERDIEARGVEDLPKYYFRDDALAVYRAIKKYVAAVVNPHYTDPDTLEHDYEIQGWAELLSATYEEGGCQLSGVPGNGRFANCDQLIETITSVIYISSTSHAAVNFLQYEEYGYPLNYPALLYGEPPRRKIGNEELDILQCLPTKKTTLGTLAITHLLSQRATRKLGDFEINYQFDKIGKAAEKQFRHDLQEIEEKCEKDKKKEEVYDILNPKFIPNAISI